MLKITQTETGNGTAAIKLEGKLLEPWLDEVCNMIAAAPIESLASLDLSGLTFADTAGVLLLTRLLEQGIAINSCSPFVAELLHWNPSSSRN